MMKSQQDKMALIFLIADVFGCVYMDVVAFCSSKSAGVFGFSLGCTVKKLLAK